MIKASHISARLLLFEKIKQLDAIKKLADVVTADALPKIKFPIT